MKRTFSQANAARPKCLVDGKELALSADDEMPHTLAFEDVREISVDGQCVWTPHLPHKLRRLTIRSSHVPATLRSLRHLTVLVCHYCNELTEIPPMQLELLDCSFNWRLRSVKALARVIDCSHCNISDLPVFGTELEKLDASWNKLRNGITGQLWGLTHLNLSYNDLGSIDFGCMPCLEEANVAHCDLVRITGSPSRKLVAQWNHLKDLPREVANLQELDVSCNILTRLPQLPRALSIIANDNLLEELDTCSASIVNARENAIRKIYMRPGLVSLDVRDTPWRFELSYPATLRVLQSEVALPFGHTLAGFFFSLEVMRESVLPDDFLRSVLAVLQSEVPVMRKKKK